MHVTDWLYVFLMQETAEAARAIYLQTARICRRSRPKAAWSKPHVSMAVLLVNRKESYIDSVPFGAHPSPYPLPSFSYVCPPPPPLLHLPPFLPSLLVELTLPSVQGDFHPSSVSDTFESALLCVRDRKGTKVLWIEYLTFLRSQAEEGAHRFKVWQQWHLCTVL